MKTKTFSFSVLTLIILFFIGCTKEHLNQIPVAEAGNGQVIQLPVDSVEVTGTGADADGKVASYLWSEVSGPAAATIINPGAATTWIKGLKEGLYSFQFMVVDDKGVTGIDTVSIKVNPSVIHTISLQANQNQNETMLAIKGTSDVSDYSSPEITAAAWTNGGDQVYVRSLFKFDFSEMPSHSTILSAKLTLYSNPTPLNGDLIHANSGVNNTTLIQRITSSWDKYATWNMQPSTETDNQIILSHTNQSNLDITDIDVTDMVKKMHSTNNYGFMVKLQNEVTYTSRIFCSSKYSDASKHPKLVITYQQ